MSRLQFSPESTPETSAELRMGVAAAAANKGEAGGRDGGGGNGTLTMAALPTQWHPAPQKRASRSK